VQMAPPSELPVFTRPFDEPVWSASMVPASDVPAKLRPHEPVR
jgi:hypothetical protein